MRILLLSVGTRGDMEPFAGVGVMLKGRGHEVICAFPDQYAHVAEESGLHFVSLGSEILEASFTEDEKEAVSGKGRARYAAQKKTNENKMAAFVPFRARQRQVMDEVKPDLVVYHMLCVYALLYGMKTNTRTMRFMMQPCVLHEVRHMPHMLFSLKFPVRLSYRIARRFMVDRLVQLTKETLDGIFTKDEIEGRLMAEPAFYNMSPSLFPQPDYWPRGQKVAGFWDRNKIKDWTPPQELVDFIGRHEKILFITLGSIPSKDPEGLSRMLVDILQEENIPAIINESGGSLVRVFPCNQEQILFVDSVPYEWIFPRMYATLHHGGSGTTHSSLRGGCATMAIPHSADQPHIDRMIRDVGAGPRGIHIRKLTRSRLKARIIDLYTNPRYKEVAARIGRQMAGEDYADELYDYIMEYAR